MKRFLVAMGPITLSAFVAFCCIVPIHAADENPAGEKAAAEKPAEKKPLPSAKEILERYSKAIGGKEAFTKHNSQHALGTVEMQGAKGTLEVFAARPNKLLMKTTIPGAGEFNTGYDGKVAWMTTSVTGPMILDGKMRDQIAAQADFDQALHDPAHYTKAEVLGLEKFNGEECYKVHLIHRSGFDSVEYFSTKTGLQRGFSTTQESPLGPVKAVTVVTDYKQFGDLFMPSRISQKAMGVEMVMTIEEMEYDKVDPAVFVLPDDVKTSLEQPAADKSDAAAPTTKTKVPNGKK